MFDQFNEKTRELTENTMIIDVTRANQIQPVARVLLGQEDIMIAKFNAAAREETIADACLLNLITLHYVVLLLNEVNVTHKVRVPFLVELLDNYKSVLLILIRISYLFCVCFTFPFSLCPFSPKSSLSLNRYMSNLCKVRTMQFIYNDKHIMLINPHGHLGTSYRQFIAAFPRLMYAYFSRVEAAVICSVHFVHDQVLVDLRVYH